VTARRPVWNRGPPGGDHGSVCRRITVLLVTALAVAGLLAGCGGSSSAAPKLGPDDVLVADFSFTPATLTVKAGTTVSLANPPVFNSGTPKGTGTFAFTFSTPGTYQYVCQVHPSMRGTVIVTP